MHASYFATLYGYNCWANHRILRTAEGLTELQFTSASSCDDRSLRGTLTHIMGTEWMWFQNHGTQHHSEAAVMLSKLDQSPGEMDLVAHIRESRIN